MLPTSSGTVGVKGPPTIWRPIGTHCMFCHEGTTILLPGSGQIWGRVTPQLTQPKPHIDYIDCGLVGTAKNLSSHHAVFLRGFRSPIILL